MVGKKPKRVPKNRGKSCADCGANMPARDAHDYCVGCLGVDHAVLAANAAGDCEVCAQLPKNVKDARLHRAREACEMADQQDAGEPQEAEEEPPIEVDPVPAKTRATSRGASPRQPPPQQDEEEVYEVDEYAEYRHYDDGYRCEGHDEEEAYDVEDVEEEEELYGDYTQEFAAELRKALRYEREKAEEAAQAADLDPEPVADARPTRLPPLVCDESDPIDIFKNAAECCGVPWPSLPSTSVMHASSIFRAFGGEVEPKRDKLVIPIGPDFADVLTASWADPSEDKLVASLLKRFETHGAEEAGMKSLPPMNRHVAAHLLKRNDLPRNKPPVFDGAHEREVSKLVKAAYASAASAAEATNAVTMLQYSMFSLLHDIQKEKDGKPTQEQILMLRRLHREQAAYTVHIAATTGRVMAQLIQVERSRWLNLKDAKVDIGSINQKVKPGSLFSESLPEMVGRYEEEKKTREALRVLMPTPSPKPAFARKPGYGSVRGGRSWSRDRPTAPRQGPTGAMRPKPPAPDHSERRPEKRRFPQSDAPPPFRGRGRGRGTRGSSAGRSAK